MTHPPESQGLLILGFRHTEHACRPGVEMACHELMAQEIKEAPEKELTWDRELAHSRAQC